VAELVVFTDLDGTLVAPGRGPGAPVRAALARLLALRIPVVFASARTRAELLWFQRHLGLEGPCIVENGSAVLVPRRMTALARGAPRATATHWVFELGVAIAQVRRTLASLPPVPGLKVRAFGQLGLEEVMALTGLDRASAERCLEREYDETLALEGPPEALEAFRRAVEAAGLRLVHGGTFFHALGPADKGRAMALLASRYRDRAGQVLTAAFGNAANDLPMLEAADLPVWLGPPGEAPEGSLRAASWPEAVEQVLAAAFGRGPGGQGAAARPS
jgi:mannosyl-3-phosphoglycerate phosphatase